MSVRSSIRCLALVAFILAACSPAPTDPLKEGRTGSTRSSSTKSSPKPKPSVTDLDEGEDTGGQESGTKRSPVPSPVVASPKVSPSPSPSPVAPVPSGSPVAGFSAPPGGGNAPGPFNYIRSLVPAVTLSTESTAQMALADAGMAQALLIPNGTDIAVTTTLGVKVGPYTLKTLLNVDKVESVQALAVSGLKVYAIGLIDTVPSLITLTISSTTFTATATSTPLTGSIVRKIGGLVLKDPNTLLAVDTLSSAMYSIPIATGVVTVFAGKPTESGSVGVGAAADVRFNHPTSLQLDGTTLYVLDTSNNRILAGDLTAGTFSVLTGTTTPGKADGPFATATFNGPVSMFLAERRLYVADTINNTIRELSLTKKTVDTFTTVVDGNAGILPFGRGVGVLNGTVYGADNRGSYWSFKPSI